MPKRKAPLPPSKQLFVNEYAKHGNKTQAVRVAFPDESAGKSPSTLSNKGYDLLQEEDVQLALATQRQHINLLASKAIQKIDQIISTGKEHNALDASKFIIEQAQGRARQTLDVQSTSVNLTLDFTAQTDSEQK